MEVLGLVDSGVGSAVAMESVHPEKSVTINFYKTKSICLCHLKTYTDGIEMTKNVF